MAIFVSKKTIKSNKSNTSSYIPKKIVKKFLKKEKSFTIEFGPFDGISRVPFGGDVFGEYAINPSTEKFEAYLSDELSLILEMSPPCVDGQNGDVLDNVIDKWMKLAEKNIDEQKNMRNIALRTIIDSRKSNLNQAEEYIKYEEEELKKIDDYLIELKNKLKDREKC